MLELEFFRFLQLYKKMFQFILYNHWDVYNNWDVYSGAYKFPQ